MAATTAHTPSNETTPEPAGMVLMIEVGSCAPGSFLLQLVNKLRMIQGTSIGSRLCLMC